jgi:glycosyltransferase involved in cell wall biosynthesis
MWELGCYLTRRGHDVVVVSTRPGAGLVERGESGRRILHRQFWAPWMGHLRVQPHHIFSLTCLGSLLSLDADVVHCLHFTDGFAAALARRFRRRRTVLQMFGAPLPAVHYRFLPPEHFMIRRALAGADRLVACSAFIRDLLHTHYAIDPPIIFPPVNVQSFPFGAGPPDGRPTILSLADFDVRRKGVRVLVKAFALAKERVPEARLRLSGKISDATRAEVLRELPQAARADIELLGLGTPEELPRQYREASVTVLPSMWEPSGGVLLESLSAGTPVVATNHGGLPEFVAPGVGVLFEPGGQGEEASNAEGLAQALLDGLALAQREGTRQRCRQHAERFSWEAIGPRIEELYSN